MSYRLSKKKVAAAAAEGGGMDEERREEAEESKGIKRRAQFTQPVSKVHFFPSSVYM